MRKIILLLVLTTIFVVAQDKQKLSKTVQSLERWGYVNVQQLDETIQVSLMYARADNFTGGVSYDDSREAYLHPRAAQALVKAQKRLKGLHPDLRLRIHDIARPMSIQQKMWDKVKHTSKYLYVSDPARGGGLHNYGPAVDLTLCNLKSDTLDMGIKVGYMGRAAHIDNEAQLMAHGRTSRQVRKNRQLPCGVMTYAGFKPLRAEWWHFNSRSWVQAKRYYQVIKQPVGYFSYFIFGGETGMMNGVTAAFTRQYTDDDV